MKNAVKWTILDKIGGEIVNLEHRFSGLCLFLLPKSPTYLNELVRTFES